MYLNKELGFSSPSLLMSYIISHRRKQDVSPNLKYLTFAYSSQGHAACQFLGAPNFLFCAK